MPTEIEKLLSKYGRERIKKALEKNISDGHARVDNTRTRATVSSGHIPAYERPLRDRSDVGFDENPMGFIPVVGDILQGGQAIRDAYEAYDGEGDDDYKKYKLKKAALGAAAIFAPNLLAEPIKHTVNGVTTLLRRAPKGTVDIFDAIRHPYRGRNIITHGVDADFVHDIVNGEAKAMTPSLAINRIDDYNVIGNAPYRYGDYTFIGDKSLLDDSVIYAGDAMSPIVAEVFSGGYSKHVPLNLQDEVAEDLWNNTIRGPLKATGPKISIEDLYTRRGNTADMYFEAIHHGSVPYRDFRAAVVPEPGRSLHPLGITKNQEEDTINELLSNGVDVHVYDPLYKPYTGYNDWAEKILDVSEGDGILFESGGSIHIKPSHRGRLTELKARTGKTEAELYNDGNPAHKRMVVFARNSRKWSHADGGLLETPEKTEYANKWDSISNARYGMANDALLRSGSNAKDADRLARFLASQSALEAGWVDTVKGNNYAGYMSNGKRMSFDSTDDFWDYHIKNLDERWPEWRNAQTIDDYYNTINNTALGLTTKELFDEYNRNHRDNPAYIYAPDWQNENYLKKLQSIYNKYISTYVKPMFDAGGMLKRMSSIYKTKEEMIAAIERAKASK